MTHFTYNKNLILIQRARAKEQSESKYKKTSERWKPFKIFRENKVENDEHGTTPMDTEKCIEIQFTATKNSWIKYDFL